MEAPPLDAMAFIAMTNDKQVALIEVADLSRSTIKAYLYRLPSGAYYVTPASPTTMAHEYVACAVGGRVCGQHRGCQPSKASVA